MKKRKKLLFMWACLIFVGSIILGYFLQVHFFNEFSKYTHVTIVKGSWWFYFSSNLFICTLMFIGIFVFAITTIPLAIYNGIIIGSSIGLALNNNYPSISKVILSLLPHGIFEIPATILSIYIGIQGFIFYKQTVKLNFYKYILKMYSLVVFLLLLASLTESLITPNLGG
ncbi:MAG: stage II sporulation protein M [Sporolactobacillus sp.]